MMESIMEEIEWSMPECRAMVTSVQEMDPIFFLNALSSIGLAHQTDELKRFSDEVKSSEIARKAIEQLSFEGLLFSSEEEEPEILDWFHRLIETGGLYQFMSTEQQGRFRTILKVNLKLVEEYSKKLECLFDRAIMYGDHLGIDKEHVLRGFLRNVIRETKFSWLDNMK
jgi:hypothetical protein